MNGRVNRVCSHHSVRVSVASAGNLDGAYDPARIPSIDPARGLGIDVFQPLDQLCQRQAFEFCAQRVVRGDIHQLIALDDCADVQPRATDEEGQFPGSSNGVNGAVSGPLILRQGVIFGDIGDVDEMVFDSGGLSRGYLAAAQVKAAIDLA